MNTNHLPYQLQSIISDADEITIKLRDLIEEARYADDDFMPESCHDALEEFLSQLQSAVDAIDDATDTIIHQTRIDQ